VQGGRFPWKPAAGLFLVAASCALYAFRVRGARYVAGAASIVLLGSAARSVPGSPDFLRPFTGAGADPIRLLLPGAVLVAALVWGRVWCGYLCPVGVASEILGRAWGGVRLSLRLHKILKNVKYLLFAGVFTALAAGWDGAARFEPFGLFGSFSWEAVPVMYAGVFVLAALCAGRIWCVYFCPVGALLALVSRHCFVPKGKVCTGCPVIRSPEEMEGECMRCIRG